METMVTSSRSKVPVFGLILLIIATVIVGIAVGAVVAFVSQFFYLIILMPVLMAGAGGIAIAAVAKLGKVRSGLVAGIFGLLCGLLIYSTYRYGEYLIFRQDFHNEVTEKAGDKATAAEIDEFMDTALTDEVGQSGFAGYILYRAKEGEQVRLGRGSSTPITLPTPITWVYWGIELLVVAGGAAFAAAKDAGTPFCEADNKFFVTRSIGNVAKENVDQFLAAVKGSDWRGARAFLTNSKPAYPYLEVKIQKCPDCNNHPVVFEVYRKLNSKSSNDAKMMTSSVAAEQFADLEGRPALA